MKNRPIDHKFRFQLLVKRLIDKYPPQKSADVGGSKGLLAYLLNLEMWNCEVIDPANHSPITKYKNIETGKRILVAKNEATKIPRRQRYFGFVSLPCCVIHEPIVVKPNINWFDSLVAYAQSQGFDVQSDTINFKGQNRILYVI